ncbi:pathogenicity island 2 effector protein SseJ [Salmonella enterica subsp. enterica]|uniref:Pathogenicity island 2 effector protein SseJ n=1 Tax=Salmonella enterica I TaxID=59201 RepID=A0A447U2X8_SALET|nr:pathogenicity island 2 effector protein SseJ [Salmonella enterica subsp. enterica]
MFLVMGIPDLSLTPYGKHSDEKRKLKDESIAHNALLKTNVEELKRKKYPQHKNMLLRDCRCILR